MSIPSVTLFGQLLQFFPRPAFAALTRRHRADYAAKGFTVWEQFVAMLFCQLGRRNSLREITSGLRSLGGNLGHLGLGAAPVRSTLSYANAHRPADLFFDLFIELYRRAPQIAGRVGHKFRFKNPLFSLDATVIDLCLSLFPWAKFRQTKGAVKINLLLDHDGYLPAFARVGEGDVHESRLSRLPRLPKGSIVVFDRGYFSFDFFARLTEEAVFFVTRMKQGVLYNVQHSRAASGNILRDEIVTLAGLKADAVCPYPLRRVEVWLEDKKEIMVLLTNHLDFAPSTIAAIYKERWQIELFFKAIKQNLKIKTFVGTSKNALLIQIWTALIAILLLKILALRARRGWSLSNLIAQLRLHLVSFRDLWQWLDEPDGPPPLPPPPTQLELFGAAIGQRLA